MSVFPYKGVIRKAILALKYKYASAVAEELAVLMTASIKQSALSFPQKTLLVPIPLHPKREKYRGFNQSAEVGRLLAKKMGWRFLPGLLFRKISTPPQTGLDRLSRQKNICGAFSLNIKYQPLTTSHQSLVIFDDVATTGSTLNEAKKVLTQAGFKNIYCLTIAR